MISLVFCSKHPPFQIEEVVESMMGQPQKRVVRFPGGTDSALGKAQGFYNNCMSFVLKFYLFGLFLLKFVVVSAVPLILFVL